MLSEVSGSLIVRDKNLLMVFDEDREVWNVPAAERFSNEISADAAKRVSEEFTGCETEVLKYKKRLKTDYEMNGEEHVFQPYSVSISGEPDKGEWVPISKLKSMDLATPLAKIRDELVKRL
jgi:hypothetical protein